MKIGGVYNLSCPKHRRIDPSNRGSVHASCVVCHAICDAWEGWIRFQAAARRAQELAEEIKERRKEWQKEN